VDLLIESRRIIKRIALIPAFFLVFSLICCAPGLPRYSNVIRQADTEKITIEGARGELPPDRTQAILSKLPVDPGLLNNHIALMETLSGEPLVIGNKTTLLVDGPATYAAMTKAIERAKDHINFETYIFEEDEVGTLFANLLLRKQAEGVQVNLIYDSIGSRRTSREFFQRLKDAGVNVVEFNPVDILKAKGKGLITHRDHRKLIIVDGRLAFTGGINISNEYSGGSFGSEKAIGKDTSWRDTHVQIEGPAVAQFQKLFLETWHTQEGPELSGRNYFPSVEPAGKELVRAVGSTPRDEHRLAYLMYLSAIRNARTVIYITNAYFVPDRNILKELKNAVRRGVDVRLVLPNDTDHKFILYAAQARYTGLLKSGVKIYERRNTILHAKTAVIDGVWSTVGSTNLEMWSFLYNDEINTIILGTEFAEEMEELFRRDVRESTQITLEKWRKRPLWNRFREFFSRLLSSWL